MRSADTLSDLDGDMWIHLVSYPLLEVDQCHCVFGPLSYFKRPVVALLQRRSSFPFSLVSLASDACLMTFRFQTMKNVSFYISVCPLSLLEHFQFSGSILPLLIWEWNVSPSVIENWGFITAHLISGYHNYDKQNTTFCTGFPSISSNVGLF